MQYSILIVGKEGSELTAYLKKILALLPEGSYADGKNLRLTKKTKYVFMEDVSCSVIDDILANTKYKHIFTTSENMEQVNAMINKLWCLEIINLDSRNGYQLLNDYLDNLTRMQLQTTKAKFSL